METQLPMLITRSSLFTKFTNWKPVGALIMMTLLICGCATNFAAPKFVDPDNPYFESGNPGNRGYKQDEAQQFIEFCVDLDNQDDRLKLEQNHQPPDHNLSAHVREEWWDPVPIYDSRLSVAQDVNRYIHAPDKRNADDEHWAKVYNNIGEKADHVYSGKWDAQTLAKDPKLNGFGPWQNAWTLYKGRGPYTGAYAVVIRGTVFSNIPNVGEDLILNPVDAQNFLSAEVNLAGVTGTSLHGGFAHATFTLMLDDRYGVLHILKEKKVLEAAMTQDTPLYIIGHSQGAAMATMAHAFMHYALRRDNSHNPEVFSMKDAKYRLKSYGFAQPKPGNYTFAADFARITQKSDNAIVINNAIDPVPKLPLTLQSMADLDNDVPSDIWWEKLYRGVASVGARLRHIAAKDGEKFVRDHAKGYGYFYNHDKLMPIGGEKVGDSWDFVPAGRVIMVYGSAQHPEDPFFQHHATTYRDLISTQLPPDKIP